MKEVYIFRQVFRVRNVGNDSPVPSDVAVRVVATPRLIVESNHANWEGGGNTSIGDSETEAVGTTVGIRSSQEESSGNTGIARRTTNVLLTDTLGCVLITDVFCCSIVVALARVAVGIAVEAGKASVALTAADVGFAETLSVVSIAPQLPVVRSFGTTPTQLTPDQGVIAEPIGDTLIAVLTFNVARTVALAASFVALLMFAALAFNTVREIVISRGATVAGPSDDVRLAFALSAVFLTTEVSGSTMVAVARKGSHIELGRQ